MHSDASGLSASFLALGTVLAVTTMVPPANALLLTEIAIAAAWSSFIGAFMP